MIMVILFMSIHSGSEMAFQKPIHRAVFENVLRDYLLTDRKLQRKKDLKLAQRKAEMRRKKRMKGRQQSIPCARLLHILCYLIVRKEGFGIQPRGSSLTVQASQLLPVSSGLKFRSVSTLP